MIRQPRRWYVLNDTNNYVVCVCDTIQEANRTAWKMREASSNLFSVKEM